MALRIIEKGESKMTLKKEYKIKRKYQKKDEERREAICRDIEDSFQSFFEYKR